jgi:hypothetical protein
MLNLDDVYLVNVSLYEPYLSGGAEVMLEKGCAVQRSVFGTHRLGTHRTVQGTLRSRYARPSDALAKNKRHIGR